MSNNPQEGVPPDKWMSHDGIIWIGAMPDEYLLNSYKTCVRHNNPKQADLMQHIKRRRLERRVTP
jgi:hypothetical protein